MEEQSLVSELSPYIQVPQKCTNLLNSLTCYYKNTEYLKSPLPELPQVKFKDVQLLFLINFRNCTGISFVAKKSGKSSHINDETLLNTSASHHLLQFRARGKKIT